MAGDELLRSKGFDQNSYNSGDWFNRVDWSGQTSYFNQMGLPPADANQNNWTTMSPFLNNTSAVPSIADIAFANNAFLDLLRIRASTSMFRLAAATEVGNCVGFPDAGNQQIGLIVMRIGASGVSCGDNAYKTIIVLINANKITQSFAIPGLVGHTLTLHPVQLAGADATVRSISFATATGTFTVTPRTAAVFVEN
jgi:pullulanase/glycogen debranching enzyme